MLYTSYIGDIKAHISMSVFIRLIYDILRKFNIPSIRV